MKQGIQTYFPHEMLRRNGAYFFCLLRWAELITSKDFTVADIIKIYEDAVKAEFINKHVFILSAAQLLNLMITSDSFTRIRIITNVPNQQRYLIYLEKPGSGHFVLHDDGKIWDPLDPKRPESVGYNHVSYREIT